MHGKLGLWIKKKIANFNHQVNVLMKQTYLSSKTDELRSLVKFIAKANAAHWSEIKGLWFYYLQLYIFSLIQMITQQLTETQNVT